MAGPQDRDRGPSSDEKFDAVWGELLGDAPDEAPSPAGAEADPGAGSDRTKVWDDSARAPERDAAPDPGADASPDVPVGTRVGHAGTLAKEAQEAAAAREMQLLMEGAVARAGPALRLVTSVSESDEEGDAGAGAEGDAEADAGAEAGAEREADAEAAAEGDAAGAEGEASEAEVSVGAPARAVRPPRVVASPRADVERSQAPAGGGGNKMLVALVGLAIAVGVGFMLVRDPAPARTSPTLAKPPPAAPIEPDPGAVAKRPPPPRPPASIPAAQADDGGDPSPDEEGSTGAAAVAEIGESGDSRPSTAPSPSGGDIREPPPGTPEEIAAAFRKLPVSAADRAPVGGIGAGGIHIDRIWMGSQYEGGDCTGKTDRFSVSADPRPSVCLRVVHPREKEEVVVLWEQSGGSVRRSTVTIKPLHAYRTRAYLLLRREYVGDWTVRILSQDGVELASHAFQVVE